MIRYTDPRSSTTGSHLDLSNREPMLFIPGERGEKAPAKLPMLVTLAVLVTLGSLNGAAVVHKDYFTRRGRRKRRRKEGGKEEEGERGGEGRRGGRVEKSEEQEEGGKGREEEE